MTNGIELIAAERQRQIEAEGWTPEHDAEHDNAALAWAAVCYAAPEPVYRVEIGQGSGGGGSRDQIRLNAYEPWPALWRRPECDRVRALVKAGALIAAEIDRLQGRLMADTSPHTSRRARVLRAP